MNRKTEKPVLIAVSVTKIEPEPYISQEGGQLKSVSFRARSTVTEACFTRRSGPLLPSLMLGCEKLLRHGFTVVEAPENWQWGYFHIEGGWQTIVLQEAIKRVGQLSGAEETEGMGVYNPELARRVLEVVAAAFPAQLNMAELKHGLHPEPSDAALLVALDALLIDRLIEGPHLRFGPKGQLHDMALVRITSQGRRHLAEKTEPSLPMSTVIGGDQINNYGSGIATGRNSIGTINNFEREWNSLSNRIDMDALTGQLEQLRLELQRAAVTRDDFRQLGMVAEAEDHAEKKEGGKLLETLSKVGKDVLSVAERIGVEVAVKVISKAMGSEP